MTITKRTSRNELTAKKQTKSRSGVKVTGARKNIADAQQARQAAGKATASADNKRISSQKPGEFKNSKTAKTGWGGARKGAGRPHGDKQRREAIVTARRTAETCDPLKYLLSEVNDVGLDRDSRRAAAAAALPYMKPRLQALAIAAPPAQLPSWSFFSAEELRKSVRGDVEVPALPAPALPAPTQAQPVEEVPPPLRSLKRKPVPEPVDKLYDYRDKSPLRGVPIEPEFP